MAGNITIIEAQDNFQKVSREIIRNRDIDLLTLAIYVKVLYFGKQWKLNIDGLAKALNISSPRVRRAVNLLEREGYVRRTAVRDSVTGRMMGWDYFVYSEPLPDDQREPISHRPVQNPKYGETDISVEPQYGENRITENVQDNNINSIIKVDSILKLDDAPTSKRRFKKPTIAEIQEYAASIGYALNAEYFFDYYERAGWTYGNGKPIKDWKACVRLWKRRDDASKPADDNTPKEYAPKHQFYSNTKK